MKKILTISLGLLYTLNITAQNGKIKGNKIVTKDKKSVEAFHSIDLQNNFDIKLEEDSDPVVKIEADSNLLDYIKVSVRDSILTIRSSKEIKRSKKLTLTILYNTELRSIRTYGKTNLTTLSPIKTDKLMVSIHDQSEVFMTIEGTKLDAKTYEKAKATIDFSGTEGIYQVNDNSELKGISTVENLQIDLYQKGAARLEGETNTMRVRADSNSDFYGEKLKSKKTNLIVEGSSKTYILVDEKVSIESIDTSEIYLLGEPTIEITKFANESTLFKKNMDYSSGKLKL